MEIQKEHLFHSGSPFGLHLVFVRKVTPHHGNRQGFLLISSALWICRNHLVPKSENFSVCHRECKAMQRFTGLFIRKAQVFHVDHDPSPIYLSAVSLYPNGVCSTISQK